MRLVAFACFVSAAFAWVPPCVDRVGLAALGFAFLSLSVGRLAWGGRPSPMPAIPPTTRALQAAADELGPERRDAILGY